MEENKKYHTSEWVSPAHPDKIADGISEHILDKLIAQDPKTRYALEVQIKDFHVSLAGEITTKAKYDQLDLVEWTREAINKIGYTSEYVKRFTIGQTIFGDGVDVDVYVSMQSGDIANGVDKDAWGDQGIFFGYYCSETENGMGKDHELAKKIGTALYENAKNTRIPLGLDIKTQVSIITDMMDGSFEVDEVIVAIPTGKGMTDKMLKQFVTQTIMHEAPEAAKAKLIINGTGLYQVHGPIGDSGTTGRKLAVDFYGSRSRIGGGSPFTKDASKADLTLNLYAYDLAKQAFKNLSDGTFKPHHVETELSCCIGKRDVTITTTAFDDFGVPFYTETEKKKVKPSTLIKKYGLDKPVFFEMNEKGLFTRVK